MSSNEKNDSLIKFNTWIYWWDEIKTNSIIDQLKNSVSDLIWVKVDSNEFKNNIIDKKTIEWQILSKMYDLELKAKFIEFIFNHPPLNCSRINIPPIINVYSWPKESDLIIVNDEYINACWWNEWEIRSKNPLINWKKPSAEICRQLAKENKLYDEIFDKENASKARLKAHEKFNTAAQDDVYEMKNTWRFIKYHRFLDQESQWTIRIWEDVTENSSFRNYIQQNIKDIPLDFTKDLTNFIKLISQKETSLKDCKYNLVTAIKKLRSISNIWDMLYNWPFLVSAILNFNEKECVDKLVLANKAFVWTTEYPIEELNRLYEKWLYNNSLYSNVDQKKYIEEMVIQLKNIWHYNEYFSMETLGLLIKNIWWDTYYMNIWWKEWSIRIWSIIKEEE